MAKENPHRRGYLLVQLSGSNKKKWPKKYCLLFNFSNQGIERLELYDSEDDVGKHSTWRIVTLEDCIRISEEPQKNQPHVFSVVTKCGGTHLFAASSPEETRDWMSACQGVAFRDSFSNDTSYNEDNELYCPSGDGVYRVTLATSEVTQRCGLSPGEYILVVAPEQLQLQHPDSQSLLFTWPYRFIRRYGFKRGRFYFEAGRKCASGEGSFDLVHSNSQDIFRCMASKMNSMKQKLNGAVSSGSLNMLDGTSGGCGFSTCSSNPHSFLGPSHMDIEGLDAAVSMNPRSRSPLVPSGSLLCPVVSSANGNPATNKNPPPSKPPRKNPPPPRYDEVEVRPEPNSPNSSSIIISPTTNISSNDNVISPSIFPRPQHLDLTSDYDKLDHFGSTPKLDDDPSYTTIFRQDTTGYGVIRKVTPPRHQINGIGERFLRLSGTDEEVELQKWLIHARDGTASQDVLKQ